MTLRLVFFALVSVTLMVLDHRFNHLQDIRSALSVAVYPVQYGINAPFAVSDWASENLSSRSALLKENERYRIEHMYLKVQLQKLYTLESENLRLRELLQSTQKVGERVLIGGLLEVDLDPFTRQIMLNKGKDDEVYVGQPLLDANGVVGQVIEVGPFTSRAMMITDPSHAIPVQVLRTGMRAIAVGTGASGDGLELPHIPNNADIAEDDLLVTSGLGRRFPPGYPVGRITRIEVDATRPFAEISAEPIAHLDRIREVLLVWREERQIDAASGNGAKP